MRPSQSRTQYRRRHKPARRGRARRARGKLRLLKVWAGSPSYDAIKDRVNATWLAAGRPGGESTGKSTVADCFRPGRRRISSDLVIAVVEAMHPDAGYVAQWQQMLQVVGEAWTLDSLGTVHTRRGQVADAHRQALVIFRETGERGGEASAGVLDRRWRWKDARMSGELR